MEKKSDHRLAAYEAPALDLAEAAALSRKETTGKASLKRKDVKPRADSTHAVLGYN